MRLTWRLTFCRYFHVLCNSFSHWFLPESHCCFLPSADSVPRLFPRLLMAALNTRCSHNHRSTSGLMLHSCVPKVLSAALLRVSSCCCCSPGCDTRTALARYSLNYWICVSTGSLWLSACVSNGLPHNSHSSSCGSPLTVFHFIYLPYPPFLWYCPSIESAPCS